MATTNSGAFTIVRIGVSIDSDNSTVLKVQYTNAGGHVVAYKYLNIPADSTKPITDQFGNVINATVPSALATDITTFLNEIDTILASGASAGKLDL